MWTNSPESSKVVRDSRTDPEPYLNHVYLKVHNTNTCLCPQGYNRIWYECVKRSFNGFRGQGDGWWEVLRHLDDPQGSQSIKCLAMGRPIERTTGSECVHQSRLINEHTHTHTHRFTSFSRLAGQHTPCDSLPSPSGILGEVLTERKCPPDRKSNSP